MPAAGYAYAIDPRIIDKSLKRRIFFNAQDQKFVQCVSPKLVGSLISTFQVILMNFFTFRKRNVANYT